MEIKPQELRIGNLVDRNGIMEVLGIGANNKLVIYDHYNKERLPYGLDVESFKGIDLTPEWLEKLGFKKSQHIFKTAFWNIDVVGHQLMINPENGAVVIAFDGNQIINPAKIQYVHQLQNLYFALTGNELAIDNKSL